MSTDRIPDKTSPRIVISRNIVGIMADALVKIDLIK